MSATVNVELPRRGFGEDLAATLARRGFHAELVEDGDRCALHVSYAADERDRLLGEVAHAIERWLGERMMPLVVERADGACIVRPPAD
jgi:hypothetical protein